MPAARHDRSAGPADLPLPLPDPGYPDASAFPVVSATGRRPLMAGHEWQARDPAAALAPSIDAPLIDAIRLDTLDAHEALESMPEARRRFTDGELPPGARLMVRHRTSRADDFHWAQVEPWANEDTALILDAGRDLRPPVTPGAATSLPADLIFDWAVWVDGDGVTEGARTEGIGRGF